MYRKSRAQRKRAINSTWYATNGERVSGYPHALYQVHRKMLLIDDVPHTIRRIQDVILERFP